MPTRHVALAVCVLERFVFVKEIAFFFAFEVKRIKWVFRVFSSGGRPLLALWIFGCF